MRQERISDRLLCEAVARAELGVIDANLGGGLIKQRVARSSSGRSGGYRTLIAYRAARRSMFLYGFAKNERDNIGARELADLKVLAGRFLSMTEAEIELALRENELKELACDDQTQATRN
jgi:hypothetical protein